MFITKPVRVSRTLTIQYVAVLHKISVNVTDILTRFSYEVRVIVLS